MPEPRHAASVFGVRKRYSYPANTLFELDDGPAMKPTPLRNFDLEAGRGGRKPVFQSRLCGSTLQPLPFIDGNKHGCLNTAPGNDLRPLAQGRVQQFAESRLRFLYLPFHILQPWPD